MNRLSKLAHKLAYKVDRYSKFYQLQLIKRRLGKITPTSVFKMPNVCSCPEKIYLYENTSILEDAIFIISPKGETGRFIMKRNSGAAQGLTIITNLHHRVVGKSVAETEIHHLNDEDKDIVVEEDVTIGAGVTLMPGVKIGRGASIGAGAVCTKNVPPYSIAMGNPAQVVGFVFTPEQIIEHEKALYPEEERLPLAKLEKNYQRYYLNHINDIAKYTNISL